MKAIRLITGILLCVVLCCSSMAVCLADTDSNQVLNVYNWGVYMDLGGNDGAYYDQKASMDVNAEFEKWYKDTYGETIRVNYVTYENNEAMYQKLVVKQVFHQHNMVFHQVFQNQIRQDFLK